MRGKFLSGRPGSNRRHSAWKADALPAELLPLIKRHKNKFLFGLSNKKIYILQYI